VVGFVLLRLRAHRLLVVATLLTVLLTTSVLAALAGFSSSVGDAGVRRTLLTTDAAGAPLLLQDNVDYQGRAQADAVARTIAVRAFPGLPVGLRSLAVSDPLGLPPAPHSAAGADPDGTTLASLDHSEVRLLSGSWPSTGSPGEPVPVAVPNAAVARLDENGRPVRPGLVLTLRDSEAGHALRIRITGVYAARNTADPYWQLDPLGGKGASVGVSGSSYGPLLVDDSSFASGAVPQYGTSWLASADFSGLHTGQLAGLSAANSGTAALVSGQQDPAFSGFNATTVLPTLLTQLQQSVLVARSTLLVAVLQLVLLAVMTLLLAARLLAEERESENALLRARGAAPQRLITLAAAEAVVLVLPAAVFAPLLAGPLIRLIGGYGPLAASGVRLDGPLPDDVWWAALIAAAGSALVMFGPTLLRARSWSEQRRQRTRRAALPGLLRGGADLALVALAVAACWQLEHDAAGSGGALNANSQGALGIDPVLVAAPTLALCAGTVLALRLLPLAARVADRLSGRARGLPAALIGWQLARRPQQSAGPILVLALAAAIGTLALGQSTSWQHSQQDQAAFDTGADLRVANTGNSSFGQAGAFSTVPGVSAVVPVARQSLHLDNGRTGELLALDARTEAGLLDWRPDLLHGESVEHLLAPLADPDPPAAQQGIPLPGRPTTLSLDVSAGLSGPPGSQAAMTTPDDELLVTVTDRYRLSYTLGPMTVPLDGAAHTVSVDLAALAGAGVPGYPLTVTGITLQSPVSEAGPVRQDFTVHAIDSDGTAAVMPSGFAWSAAFAPGPQVPSTPDSRGRTVNLYQAGDLRSYSGDPAEPLALSLDSGTLRAGYDGSPSTPSTTLTPRRTAAPSGPLPAVVDQQFLDSTSAHVGSVVPLSSGAGGVDIRIAAVVAAIPGTGAAAEQGISGSTVVQGTGLAGATPATDGGAVLVDLPSYDDHAATTVQDDVLQPTEWWLYVGSGSAKENTSSKEGAAKENQVAAALSTMPGVQAVYVADQTRAALTTNPLGTGPEAALLAALVLAVVLASISFATDAAAIIRRRAGETAVLRALGAPRRLIARSIATQLLIPTVVGVGTGLTLGVVLAELIVPVLILTPQATAPVPPVIVDIPVGGLCLLGLAVAGVPLLVAALSGLRGGDPAQRLRHPEES